MKKTRAPRACQRTDTSCARSTSPLSPPSAHPTTATNTCAAAARRPPPPPFYTDHTRARARKLAGTIARTHARKQTHASSLTHRHARAPPPPLPRTARTHAEHALAHTRFWLIGRIPPLWNRKLCFCYHHHHCCCCCCCCAAPAVASTVVVIFLLLLLLQLLLLYCY